MGWKIGIGMEDWDRDRTIPRNPRNSMAAMVSGSRGASCKVIDNLSKF